MNPVAAFFLNNFALFCIAIAMVFMCFQSIKTRKAESIYSLFIIGATLLLALLLHLEQYGKANHLVAVSTVCGFLGYVLRPIVILFFIALADDGIKKRKLLFLIPLGFNLIIYSSSLFLGNETLSHLVFYYADTEAGLVFHRGTGIILNFFSHLISALYLGYLLYVSFKKLKGKHISQGVTLLICAFFVIVAVVLESALSNSNLSLLNITIAIAALFYYLFLYSERAKSDPLTGLFNRASYYFDLKKMENSINGVIQLDMNGLKYINDNLGHEAGDEALKVLARLMEDSLKRNMYLYRVGGDEFTILIINGDEEAILDTIRLIKEKLGKTKYYCSMGYAIKKPDSEISVEELLKLAEAEMYRDKESFYAQGIFERRRQNAK